MSINLLIKDRLRLYLKLLREISDYTRNHTHRDNDIAIPSNIKATLRSVMCSVKLCEHLTQRSCVNTTKPAQRETVLMRYGDINVNLIRTKHGVNTSCFNQRGIWSINQFYSTVNEIDLINVNLCYLMFDVIKACLLHGIEMKGNYAHSKANVVLTPKIFHRKRCSVEAYASIDKDKRSEMSILSKLYICNRSVESSHNNKYTSVKVGTTPRLKGISASSKRNNNSNNNIHVVPLFNISKTRRESLCRQAPYGQRKGYLKVGYYVKQRRSGDISRSLSKHNLNVNACYNYKNIFKYYNMLNYS